MILSRLLFLGAFRSSLGAIMYDVSDAYVESTLSRRLIVAVFIYWRRVRRVVDWSWQFFVVGVEPSQANSMSWRHTFTVTYAQYP